MIAPEDCTVIIEFESILISVIYCSGLGVIGQYGPYYSHSDSPEGCQKCMNLP